MVVSRSLYLRVVQAVFASLYFIIISGSLVRLTGSGLGCADWPACSEGKFIDVSSMHAAIEQLNRLFTGVVALSVVIAVLLSFGIRPKRRDLVVLSSGLMLGVLAQVVIGGVVVLTGLNPFSNITHFLVSIMLMTNAFVLLKRAKLDGQQSDLLMRDRASVVDTRSQQAVLAIVVLAGLAIITGTVVTGTGPHAGDENAVRIGFAITSVVRVHSMSVLLCLATSVGLFFHGRRDPATWRVLAVPLERFLAVGFLQGLVGYVQYFSGIPVPLVAVHVAVSVAVWLSAADMYWHVLACIGSRLPGSTLTVLD